MILGCKELLLLAQIKTVTLYTSDSGFSSNKLSRMAGKPLKIETKKMLLAHLFLGIRRDFSSLFPGRLLGTGVVYKKWSRSLKAIAAKIVYSLR